MTDRDKQAMTRERFLDRYGGVVEHSPWVAEAVWERYPSAAKSGEFESLSDAFGKVIRTASRERRVELLRAHPELACGVVGSGELSEASRNEQEGAGLDRCTPEEFVEFQSLNLEYKKQFGFPFIIAVKGMSRKEILERFRGRIERTSDEEFTTAIENVIRIVGYRIAEVIENDD